MINDEQYGGLLDGPSYIPIPNRLPPEFKFSQQYCFVLNDILVAYLDAFDQSELWNLEITFEEDERDRINDLTRLAGDDLVSNLLDTEYETVSKAIVYRHTVRGLISDYCHFIYESLACAQKGKMTVAYALLRKPLKDNLYHMEWILTDPEDYFRALKNHDRKQIAVEKVPVERKKMVIESAIQQSDEAAWSDMELLYDLRYNKNADWGFESGWNMANHIVTTYKAYETEPLNLNFVFSNVEDIRMQWLHLYSMLPLILYHAVSVGRALFRSIAELEERDVHADETRMKLGFIQWAQEEFQPVEFRKSMSRMVSSSLDFDVICPTCDKNIPYSDDLARQMIINWSVTCQYCGETSSMYSSATDDLEH